MTDPYYRSGTYEPEAGFLHNLTPQDFYTMKTYVDRGGEETSFDDLFDAALFRTARSSFTGARHRLAARGHTYYRPRGDNIKQGLPSKSITTHGGYDLGRAPAHDPTPSAGPSTLTYNFAG